MKPAISFTYAPAKGLWMTASTAARRSGTVDDGPALMEDFLDRREFFSNLNFGHESDSCTGWSWVESLTAHIKCGFVILSEMYASLREAYTQSKSRLRRSIRELMDWLRSG